MYSTVLYITSHGSAALATELTPITVYITPELFEILKGRASADGRSLSNFVQRQLEAAFGGRQVQRAYAYGMPSVPSADPPPDATPVEPPLSRPREFQTHVRRQPPRSLHEARGGVDDSLPGAIAGGKSAPAKPK